MRRKPYAACGRIGDHGWTLSNTCADGLRRGSPVIGYAVTESPIGHLVVAVRGDALTNIEWGPDALEDLHADVGEDFARAPAAEKLCQQLDEYFLGVRRHFDTRLDLSGLPPFRRAVLETLRDVPYASTISYGDLAVAAGRPGAARAAGTACATNPIPIVIPCHRVVAANGIGGYGGGLDTKRYLLELEAANS